MPKIKPDLAQQRYPLKETSVYYKHKRHDVPSPENKIFQAEQKKEDFLEECPLSPQMMAGCSVSEKYYTHSWTHPITRENLIVTRLADQTRVVALRHKGGAYREVNWVTGETYYQRSLIFKQNRGQFFQASLAGGMKNETEIPGYSVPAVREKAYGPDDFLNGLLTPGTLPESIEEKIIGKGARYQLNAEGWLERRDIIFVYRGDTRVGLDQTGMLSARGVGHDFDFVPNPIPASTQPSLAMKYRADSSIGVEKEVGRLYMIYTEGLRVAPLDDNIVLNAERIHKGALGNHLQGYTEPSEVHISGPIEAWRIVDITEIIKQMEQSVGREKSLTGRRAGYLLPVFEAETKLRDIGTIKQRLMQQEQGKIAEAAIQQYQTIVQAQHLPSTRLKKWRTALVDNFAQQIRPPDLQHAQLQIITGSIYDTLHQQGSVMPAYSTVILPAHLPTSAVLTDTIAFDYFYKQYIRSHTVNAVKTNTQEIFVLSQDFIGMYSPHKNGLRLLFSKNALYDFLTLNGQFFYPAGQKTIPYHYDVGYFLSKLGKIRDELPTSLT